MEFIFPIGDALNKFKRDQDNRVEGCFILGAKLTNKTSFLMQAAVTGAFNGSQVLFISPQKLNYIPVGVHGMPQPSSGVMDNITFLYANKREEIQNFIALLHLKPSEELPAFIILDDLHHYCLEEITSADVPGCMVKIAGILALMLEAASFCSNAKTTPVGSSGNQLHRVFVSWTHVTDGAIKVKDIVFIAADYCNVWQVMQEGSLADQQRRLFQLRRESRESVATITLTAEKQLLMGTVTLERKQMSKAVAVELKA